MQRVPIGRFQSKFPPAAFNPVGSQYAADEFLDSQYRTSVDLNTFQTDFNDIYTKIEETNAKCSHQIIENLAEKQANDFSVVLQNLGKKNFDLQKTEEQNSESIKLKLKKVMENIENLKKSSSDSYNTIFEKFSKASNTLNAMKIPQTKRPVKITTKPCKKVKK